MKTASWVLIAVGALGGCATVPPPELVQARAEYDRASHGAAAQLAPDRVAQARQALAAAETSFADYPRAERTRDLAYAATRASEVAEASAREAEERQRRATAESALAAAQQQA